MLVPSMSPAEVYAELIEDGVSIMKTMATKLRIQFHLMKRTHNIRWVETLHLKSAKNNNWSVTVHITPQKQEINYYIKSSDENGISAYSIFMFDGIPVLIKYGPHFFKRYRERMQLEETRTEQILKKFFRSNAHYTPAYDDNEGSKIVAVVSLPEGLGLGRHIKDSPLTEIKTFIPHEMLNKGQRELAKMLSDDEEYNEHISFIGS